MSCEKVVTTDYVWTCDFCDTTTITKEHGYVSPKGWDCLSTFNDDNDIILLDRCPECIKNKVNSIKD